MPLILDAGSGPAMTLDETVAALDAHPLDARDEGSIVAAAPLLARLGRNDRFLGDIAIEELKRRHAREPGAGGYGPQVLVLRPPDGRYLLRANFWPAAGDSVLRQSGAAAFFYGHAHDHNFPFVTYGYLGPGYASDYWERDPAVEPVPGAPANLTFVGRRTLSPGTLMLYRARRDVHRQLPPDAFSVSLNILVADPAQAWITQYRFDPEADRVLEALSVAPAEVLLTLAVHLADGVDLATEFAKAHPFARMRTTARTALDRVRNGGGLLT